MSGAEQTERRAPGYLMVVPWDVREPGGVNNVINNLAAEFRRSGKFSPAILIASWDEPGITEEFVDDIPIITMRCESPWERRFDVRTLIAFLVKLPRNLRRLAKIVQRYRLQVINLQYPGLGGLNFAALKWFGLFNGALILSFHGLDVRTLESQDAFGRMLWRILLRGTDVIVACSDHLAATLADIEPGVRSKIQAIHNGINPDAESATRGSGAPDRRGRRYILNVGTFEFKKGHDILIRAFSECAADFPEMDLILVGADGPTLEAVRALAAEQGADIPERIRIVVDAGHSTVMRLMADADLFVLPSRDEPFGIVLLEAGVSRTAVIASRIGGVPEVIEDQVTGLLVEPGHPGALSAAIRALLSDDRLRETLAARHHQRVLQQFSWKRCAERYAAAIDVLNSAASAPQKE